MAWIHGARRCSPEGLRLRGLRLCGSSPRRPLIIAALPRGRGGGGRHDPGGPLGRRHARPLRQPAEADVRPCGHPRGHQGPARHRPGVPKGEMGGGPCWRGGGGRGLRLERMPTLSVWSVYLSFFPLGSCHPLWEVLRGMGYRKLPRGPVRPYLSPPLRSCQMLTSRGVEERSRIVMPAAPGIFLTCTRWWGGGWMVRNVLSGAKGTVAPVHGNKPNVWTNPSPFSPCWNMFHCPFNWKRKLRSKEDPYFQTKEPFCLRRVCRCRSLRPMPTLHETRFFIL